MVKGHAYTPEKTAAYEAMVRSAYRQGNPAACPLEGAVRVEIAAFYAVPKSASKRLQAKMRNNEMLPVIRPDWDNIGKLVCDALNGIAWKDDAQIVEASVVKRYGLTPMVSVKIEEVAQDAQTA